jgi:catechol 2,3-dioxygenase-like lactoylglutathione lyase family enzyme
VIQHVTWEVRPELVEQCVSFYELLGFRHVEPPPSLRERAAWVERHATQVHLMLVDDPATLPEGHAAVVVDDYDATLAALRDAGHQPDPRAEHWGSPRCFVRDPAGNRVEVMAFPPGGRAQPSRRSPIQ